ARTGARSLDEEFYVVPLVQERAQVFAQKRLVERIALYGAADEEGAGATKNVTHRPERQVVAGGGMGGHQFVFVENIREHQVVEMAAMRRQKQQWPVMRDLFDASETGFVDFDTVVETTE